MARKAPIGALVAWALSLALASPAGAVVDFSPSAASPVHVTSNFTFDLAPGDFNEDGHPDLAVAAGDRAAVLLNDGTGGFTVSSPFLGERVEGVAVGDFNNDSHQDIAVATTVQNANPRVPKVEVLLGDGTGGFNEAPGSPFAIGATPGCSGRMVAADFNGDGYDDLAVANTPCQATVPTVSVMLGSNTGALSVAAGSPFNPFSPDDPGSIQGIAAGKLDNDTNIDLAITGANLDKVAVLAGNGSGGFSALSGSPYATGTTPEGVALGEFSQPPRLDLAIANSQSNDVSVFENNGLGVYSVPAGSPFGVGVAGSPSPWALAAGDLNGDGNPDLAVANVSTANVSVLVHDGIDHFHPAPLGPFGSGESSQFASAQDVAIADFDGDGRPDIAVANGSPGSVSVLENASGPPSEPVFTGTEPNSPSDANSPMIRGTAGLEGNIELWRNSNCAGSPDFVGSVSDFTSGGIQVSVPDNSTTTFHAKAVDGEGSSGCSNSTITYVEDSVPPALPTFTASNPGSPSNDTTPQLQGSAESGSIVRVYDNSSCGGSPLGIGSASQFGSGILTVTVPADMSTTLYATATDAAGNASACSTSSLTYVEDSTPPAAPSGLDTHPASPSNDAQPQVTGSAEAGSTVRIYTTASCSGPPAATGTASAFGGGGIPVNLSSDGTTTFRATATDAAGNTSACSPSSVDYALDTTPPPAPVLSGTNPPSPSNVNQVSIRGLAQPGSTVSLFANRTCSGLALITGTAASLASPGLALSVPDDSTTTFSALATDAVGNTSSCSGSLTYVEDSRPPETFLNHVRVSRKHRAIASFGSDDPQATFACRVDQRPFGRCTSPVTTGRLRPGPHVFEVIAVDAAGNTDPTPASRPLVIRRR